MNDFDDLGIVNSSWLTDADWAVINRLRRIHETEGQIAVRKALRALEPESYLRVAAAFLPDKVREAIKDEMAENGITEQDLREMAETSNVAHGCSKANRGYAGQVNDEAGSHRADKLSLIRKLSLAGVI